MIEPVRIGDATLYLGDCLEILPTLDKADCLVTDPAYQLTTGGRSLSGKTMSGIFAAHNYDNRGSLMIADITWPEMARPLFDALKPNADAYVMCNDKNLLPAMQAFTAAGFGLHNVLTWDKKAPTANRWYMKNIEFTLYLWKGRARTINDPSSKQGITGYQRDETKHPTEKPIWLMERYVANSSQHQDTILDPFMGSGTTGVACIKRGRKFIGIEIDPVHFDAACQRIETACVSARANPGLFAGPPKPTEQEALL